ncbi:hypothetical protein P8605_47375, partial [Streptomyces sp. T-3]|nr:hypothetical protein [Streptomyces sp. T-3]
MAYDTGQSGTAQPGVIPLRPLTFADVLRGMFRTAVGYWRQLIVLSLAVFLVSYTLIHGAVTIAFHSIGDQAQLLLEDGTVGGPLLVVGGVVLLGTMAVTAFAVTLVHSICAVVVRHAVLGSPLTVRETWSRALSRLLAVFAAMTVPMLTAFVVLVAAAVFILYAGLGGLVVLPPAVLFLIWLWARWSLAPAAAVVEGAGPLTA